MLLAKLPIGELIFAIVITAIGGVIIVGAGAIPMPVGGADIGPRVFPYAVGTMTVIVGILLVIGLLRGRTGQAEEAEDVDVGARTGWLTTGLLVAVMVGHVFLIIPFGWPIAAAALFTGSAWILGARPMWRAPVVGIVLALVLQVIFGGLLGLSLPPGPLAGWAIFGG